MANCAISIKGLSKKFKLYNSPRDILWEFFLRRPRHTEFWALRDVNLKIKKGEIVGIIGKNGAGKSTLLKILTGLLDKTSGQIKIHGQCRAIMELGTGFHEEYSGFDNIFLGGVSLGYTRKDIKKQLPWIIDFSGLGDFINHPVRTYSTGMKSRLAFAVAFCIRPEVLIVDEALSVGDQAFVAKCTNLIANLCRDGGTALIVSHNMFFLEQNCHRVIYLKDGVVNAAGDPLHICKMYEEDMAREFIDKNKGGSTLPPLTVPLEIMTGEQKKLISDEAISVDEVEGIDNTSIDFNYDFDGKRQQILSRPFNNNSGNSYSIPIPDFLGMADNTVVGERSPLIIFEDGVPLGPAHCPHDEINQKGGGGYSHWDSQLFFSTTDNSDPNTNGREYRISMEDGTSELRNEILENLPIHIREAIGRGEVLCEKDFDTVDFIRPLRLARLIDIRLLNSTGQSLEIIECGTKVVMQATVRSMVYWKDIVGGFQVFDRTGNMVISCNSKWFIGLNSQADSKSFDLTPGINIFSASFPAFLLGAGEYIISFGMTNVDRNLHDDMKLIYERSCLSFGVIRHDLSQNVIYEPQADWVLTKSDQA